jgi:hypothetical protein
MERTSDEVGVGDSALELVRRGVLGVMSPLFGHIIGILDVRCSIGSSDLQCQKDRPFHS